MENITSPPRSRAKRACRRCNARRVKCNVMSSHPCDNCTRTNTFCEVPESRRGRHVRIPLRRETNITQVNRSNEPDELEEQNVQYSSPDGQRSVASGDGLQPRGYLPEPRSSLANGTSQPLSGDSENRELYLGESATVRCVYDEGSEKEHSSPDQNARLQYPVPEALMSDSLLPEWDTERKRRLLRFLRAEGVFDMPAVPTQEMLLATYFRWFHPCFPVVDGTDLLDRYQNNTLSPLLCNAIFSVAAVHCDDEVLAAAGVESRKGTQHRFYSRARDIYEANHEADQTTVIQALFLMSFWRGGRLVDKHTRHWLGVAISLAQSRAMHRSLPNLNPDLAKLRRRIWWSIYTRERQCSAALGLPSRIRDEDCDVELLHPTDLADSPLPQVQLAQRILPSPSSEQISYPIEMSKLAVLLGQIYDSEYIPRPTADTTARIQLKEKLSEWECQLPEHMSSRVRLGEGLHMQVAMLHLAYNNLLILLFRNTYIHNKDSGEDTETAIALQAAYRNSAIVEDLLLRNLMRHGDIQLINSLFNTLCIHAIHIHRSTGTVRSITQHRARICLLALQELQNTWQVTVWLMQLRLFFQALDHATAKCLQLNNNDALLPDRTANLFSDILAPAETTLPAPLGLNPLNNHESNDEVRFASTDPMGMGSIPGLFEWPWVADGMEDLLYPTLQMDLELPVPEGKAV